ncbi:dienelactone hydrolase family protein [Spongisporangium articulatum]|uniref:Dienelactone hydrolase family protein n=1 Tax=Spongisporangium articulatum TaxID=3362603 RepID=A0ABW8AJ41_9ACTN
MPTLNELLDTVPEPAGATLERSLVDYSQEGTALEGVLVKDTSLTGKRPGVLVIHEWNGINDYVETRTTMLARLGYVAFAPDIYGKGVRPGMADAPKVAGAFYGDLGLMRARAAAGLEQLLADGDVDPDRVVTLGFCFGGSASLELARSGAPVAGAVSLHGTLPQHAEPDVDRITARLLVLTGGADPNVPDEAIAAFQAELRTNPQVDWQVTVYAGAMHAFTNPLTNFPDHGAAYDPRADARSWRALTGFLDEVFA